MWFLKSKKKQAPKKEPVNFYIEVKCILYIYGVIPVLYLTCFFIQLYFEAVIGSGISNDMALDDIILTDVACRSK